MTWLTALPRVARYVLAGLLVAAILLGLFWVRSCQQSGQHAAEARLENGQLGAAQASGAEAVNTVAADAARTADSEAMTRENAREIRNAKGSAAAVDPAVRDAGLHALCRRAAYRDTERCRLLLAPPR